METRLETPSCRGGAGKPCEATNVRQCGCFRSADKVYARVRQYNSRQLPAVGSRICCRKQTLVPSTSSAPYHSAYHPGSSRAFYAFASFFATGHLGYFKTSYLFSLFSAVDHGLFSVKPAGNATKQQQIYDSYFALLGEMQIRRDVIGSTSQLFKIGGNVQQLNDIVEEQQRLLKIEEGTIKELKTAMGRLKKGASRQIKHRFNHPAPSTQAFPGRPPITSRYPDLIDTIHQLYVYAPGKASEKRRRDELSITEVRELRRYVFKYTYC